MHSAKYRMGEFELCPSRFELRRSGRVVKLERIPMELLILLAERRGDVVSRSEIVARLWGLDVYVDTEHGVNTAIRKVRVALRDDADRSRFVQTIAGKGYRLADVTLDEASGDALPTTPAPGLPASLPAAAVEPPLPLTPPGALRRLPPRLGAVTLVVLGIVLAVGWSLHRGSVASAVAAPRSLAVLPLANLSGDPSQDALADEITDDLITTTARDGGLRVVSRTSSMQFKGLRRPPLTDVARALGVDTVLDGSISRTGPRVHLTLQLVDAATDAHLWAETYDRAADSVYSLPAEAADTIGRLLGDGRSVRRSSHPTPSAAAHEAFLQGRYFWFGNRYDRSLEYLQTAVRLQPDYAEAWSGLADVYTVRAVAGMLPTSAVRADAAAAAEQAGALDPNLPEVHNALAAIRLFFDRDFDAADRESRAAIRLGPNLAEPHHLRSYLLTVTGHPVEALAEQRRATELDPFARPWALGATLMHLRQFDAALAELKLRADAVPSDRGIRANLESCYYYLHRDAEAAQQIAEGYRDRGDAIGATTVLALFSKGGLHAIDEWRLQQLQAAARVRYVSPLDLASLSARLGKAGESLDYLEAAYREGTPWLLFVQTDPAYDALHSQVRYRELVHMLGLPE